ncbi:MAG TPA: hypothetical protein VFA45_04325, partial [Actinomycetes bacterium]|nr:hypothetical protein [Actinomycetes bacterium]
MPPSIASHQAGTLPPWAGAWLPAGDLSLAGGRTATVSFDRDGRCRLLLTLDREADADDVTALEEAAGALPYLQLGDLEGGADYPARHADVFALPQPLPALAFNASAKVELVARRGGRRLPRRIGSLGLRTRTTLVPAAGDPADAAGQAPPADATAGTRAAGEWPAAVQVEWALAEVGRRLQALTRLGGATLCLIVLGLAVAGFLVAFVSQTWSL